MNYASTNEANNHDNDFPVMTGDDIADMVCKPASDERQLAHTNSMLKFHLDIREALGESLGCSDEMVIFRINKWREVGERLQAENARLQSDLEAAVNVMIKAGNDMQTLRDAISFAQTKLSEIDKRGMFAPSDFFTITDILDVLKQAIK